MRIISSWLLHGFLSKAQGVRGPQSHSPESQSEPMGFFFSTSRQSNAMTSDPLSSLWLRPHLKFDWMVSLTPFSLFFSLCLILEIMYPG